VSVKHPVKCGGANSSPSHMDNLPGYIKMQAEFSILEDGRMLTHHKIGDCSGRCCFHSPSDHHMVDWPMVWRSDRGIMERDCPHGIGHPDPDDREVLANEWNGVHGCDGCCIDSREDSGNEHS